MFFVEPIPNSRISGVIPSFEGGIPSDEMIECKHKNNRKGSENEIVARFFTNGEDLFVGFVTEMSMFGVMCNLTCPVIFKTDLNFESFEYIGCASQNFMTDFYSTVQIDKIN